MHVRYRVALLVRILLSFIATIASAQQYTISTPGGPVTIQLTHAGPAGDLVAPPVPESPAFRPPSIFSAPLPSGSGARALGLNGAFTALADDATAASWNPAGLLQLERPEASIVYRVSRSDASHHSDDNGFKVGENSYGNDHLNYFSLDYPFIVTPIQRNFVVALNYQEAYDFTHKFSADLSQVSSAKARAGKGETYQETQVDHIQDDQTDITVNTYKTTHTTTAFNQLLSSELVSDLDFQQEGIISAISPSLAAEVTPKFSLGASFNLYQNDPVNGGTIRSVTRARYSGASSSFVQSKTTRTTSGTYDYNGTVTLPPDADIPVPITVPISGQGTFDPFTNATTASGTSTTLVDGQYVEINEFDDLQGHNWTIGAMYTVGSLLTLGASIDLPWSAEGRQTRTIRNDTRTYDQTHTRLLDQQSTSQTESTDVRIDFPLAWAVGSVFRWTPQFYTTLDLSQTRWSQFAYQAEGQEAVNPLDGSPHGQNPLDDTWALRSGVEYLFLFERTEIPLRGGVGWEQRPALERPDDYYSFSLGTGIGLGKDPGRTIIDIAYVYTFANDVKGVIPSQTGLTSDVREQQFFISLIQHF